MSCTAYRDELVAFADHALTGRAREAVAAHLMRCDECRSELDELRGLRERVACSSAPCRVSEDLAARLRAIAGEQAGERLCLNADREPAAGTALPSQRRVRRRWALAGSSAVVTLAAGALGSAWLLAPDLREVRDPQAGAALLARDDVPLPSAPTVRAGQPVRHECPSGFSCPDELAGLLLTSRRVDSTAHPTMVRAEYECHGAGHAVVVQQSGVLSGRSGASTSGPMARVERVWQSEAQVFSVSGPADCVEAIAAVLPHEEPAGRLFRLKAGLRSLTGQRGR